MDLQDEWELAWYRQFFLKLVPGSYPVKVGQMLLGERFLLSLEDPEA